MVKSMDIQTIKTFVSVAKLGSFTKAAYELSYAQSTVTMQIQRLEEELGFPLFEKIGRHSHLTSGGKEFLFYAETILHTIEQASAIGQDPKNRKGSIHIGVLESLLFARLLPVLSQFRKKFPNMEVILKIGQITELMELLKKNKLDIIYVSNTINTDNSLNCCYKRCEELVFSVSKTHDLATKKEVCIKEVLSYPFIITEPSGYCYQRLNTIASEQGCTLNHGVSVDSTLAVCKLLDDGYSAAFLPRYTTESQPVKDNLVILNTDLPKQLYYSQLLCLKNKWISPFMENIIELIKTAYPS